MRIQDLFTTAAESLARTKSRSLLTILGIVIGIAAVILMLAIGQGAESLILSQVADLGSDLVFVEPASGDPTSGPPDPFIEQSIMNEDLEAIKEADFFSYASPAIITSVAISRGEFSDYAQIEGEDQDYLQIFPSDIKSGRYLEKSDIDSYDKVAVLGSEIAEDLFGDQDPVGQKIKIKDLSFRVIGVFDKRGSRFFQNLDKQISIPFTTMQRDILGIEYVNYIAGVAIGDVEHAKEELRWLMRELHNIDNPEGDPNKDNFFVSSQEDATEIIGVVGSVLSILLSSIAAISLVVGGIGIMNIMLVSVTERTREIGLRKAVGATQGEIMKQFLIESVLLTFVGGLVGIITGVLTSIGIGWVVKSFYLEDWSVVIPPDAIMLAAIVSTIVGLVFGIYPARSAAKLNPIEALRYE